MCRSPGTCQVIDAFHEFVCDAHQKQTRVPTVSVQSVYGNPYTGYGRIVQGKSKKIYGRINTAVPVQKKKKFTVYGKYAVYVDRFLGVNLPQFSQAVDV